MPAAPFDVSGLVAVEIVVPYSSFFFFFFSLRFTFALASCGSAVVPCDRQEHVLDTPGRASVFRRVSDIGTVPRGFTLTARTCGACRLPTPAIKYLPCFAYRNAALLPAGSHCVTASLPSLRRKTASAMLTVPQYVVLCLVWGRWL